MKKRKMLKDITIIASLIALSVVLSLFDRQISVAILTGVPPLALMAPNFKLGIANVVILIILYNYGFKFGFLAVILKVAILGLFNPNGFPMSFGGSILSFFVMYGLLVFLKKNKYIYFVSAVGGFSHSFGQIIFGFMYYGLIDINQNILDKNVLIYSPVMLLMGIITGLLMGFVAQSVNRYLNEQHIIIKNEKECRKMIYVAHRGSKVNGGVENTKEAFLGGIHAGAEALECDVRVTKDGTFVIFHDNTVERLTKESEQPAILDVNQANYEELKDICLTQSYLNQTYHGKIMLFTEYLELCRDFDKIPIIELKWTNGIYSDNNDANNYNYSNLDRLIACIKEYQLFEKAYVMTSMKGCLEYLRRKYPTIRLQWLCKEQVQNGLDWCITNKIHIDVEHHYCTKELVECCHKHQLLVNIWTMNEEELLSKYKKWEVDMVTSDWVINQ